jgi:hypothetical protein
VFRIKNGCFGSESLKKSVLFNVLEFVGFANLRALGRFHPLLTWRTQGLA